MTGNDREPNLLIDDDLRRLRLQVASDLTWNSSSDASRVSG